MMRKESEKLFFDWTKKVFRWASSGLCKFFCCCKMNFIWKLDIFFDFILICHSHFFVSIWYIYKHSNNDYIIFFFVFSMFGTFGLNNNFVVVCCCFITIIKEQYSMPVGRLLLCFKHDNFFFLSEFETKKIDRPSSLSTEEMTTIM